MTTTYTLNDGESGAVIRGKINDSIANLNSGKAETSDLTAKQDTLISGTNIKTLNGVSVLGPGDITVPTLSDGDKGDITITGGVWAIDNDVVTFAKMQNLATNKILGRTTAGTGDIEELTPTQVAGMLPVASPSNVGSMSIAYATKLENLDTWIPLTTMNLAGLSSTETSGTLTSYNLYKIEYDLSFFDTTTIVGMQCNGVTTSNYNSTQIYTNTISSSFGLNSFLIAQANSDYVGFGEIIINAKRSSYKPAYGNGYTGANFIKGVLAYGSDITSFGFLRWTGTGSITGTVKIYGKN